MPRTLPSRLLVLSALTLAAALPASAQYRTPGSGIEITESRRTQLETAVEEARWNFGAIRVQPWIGIEDLAYQDPVQGPEGPTDDIHASIGAGLRFYLPIGSDTYLAAHALPEYSFWLDLDDRNQIIGRYGIGLFGFQNRLQYEVTGRQIEEISFLSDEVLRDIPLTQEQLEAKVQLRVAGSLALAFSGSRQAWDADSYEDEGNIYSIEDLVVPLILPTDPGFLIDREATRLRAGVRYLLRGERGHLGIGVQDEETRFDFASGRDNEGTSIYAEALLQGNKIDIAFDITQRELEPSTNSAFPGYDATSGGVLIALHPRATSELQFYARRDLSYSALSGASYYETNIYGIATKLELTYRSNLTAYYQTGTNDYFTTVTNHPLPNEDTSAWGATLDYELGPLGLRLGYSLSEFDSVDNQRDRQVEQISIGISLGRGGSGDW